MWDWFRSQGELNASKYSSREAPFFTESLAFLLRLVTKQTPGMCRGFCTVQTWWRCPEKLSPQSLPLCIFPKEACFVGNPSLLPLPQLTLSHSFLGQSCCLMEKFCLSALLSVFKYTTAVVNNQLTNNFRSIVWWVLSQSTVNPFVVP